MDTNTAIERFREYQKGAKMSPNEILEIGRTILSNPDIEIKHQGIFDPLGKTPVHFYSLALKMLGKEFEYEVLLPLANDFIKQYDWSREGSSQITGEIPIFMCCSTKNEYGFSTLDRKVSQEIEKIARQKAAERGLEIESHWDGEYLSGILNQLIDTPANERDALVRIMTESIDEFLKGLKEK